MSYRGRKDYDPSEPSTSSGQRRPNISSAGRTPGRTPYSRSQESVSL